MRLNKQNYNVLRARNCLNNSSIAEMATIRKATLCRALNGKECKPETIGKIAKALNCDVLDIIETEK